ncbi:hypothetical protein [Noviherbaspirillum sp. Root189]|uniref:hypothetical protein n=1 Tax=Noviherbaspirillum sp. Root189 TaxID=1736487 RepID=UPI00070C4F3F|nr:hypothetical protein [Noviherbaspirillum sp. Root189]KRB87435.1 hypothetical protein ASE07_20230 [Noviherbaspirillum sp. Root189]
MRTTRTLLFVIALLLSPCWALAQSASAVSGNATLTYHKTSNNRPLVLQWNVQGRGDIWIFPAGGIFTFNFHADHLHPGAHVGPNQIHVQGVLDTPGISGVPAGQVLAGIIYTVDGDTPESGLSRISEKIQVINKSSVDIPLDVIGMGSKPDDSEYAGPPVTDLEYPAFQTMMGTSALFSEKGSTAEAPFGPLTISRVITVRGFNPQSSRQRVTVRAGETMTILTELSLVAFSAPTTPAPSAAPQ